jgi:acyl dehydratase
VPFDPGVIGFTTEPAEASWTSTDCLLYALTVGAGPADLGVTTENTVGVAQQVLPTFPLVVTPGPWTLAELGDVDRAHLLHARQTLTLHRPLATEGRIRWTTAVTGVWDKGSAAVVDTETVALDARTASPWWTAGASLFIRGAGGWGGERGASTAPAAPGRDPDMMVSAPTQVDQALLYRLTGDRNPLHSDPTVAARGGFDRPILHGLCTYGFAVRLLVQRYCPSDPAQVRSIDGRFTRPVFPGDRLTVSAWKLAEGEIAFRTATDAGTVIDAGRLQYH